MVVAMARTRPTRAEGVRRRPKDRKAQIARASAEAFSTLGYYGVSMETIAKRVGISAAALYRHYSSKYELFRDAVLNLGQQLVDCTAFADEVAGDPQLALRRLVSALIDTAMANRESGGLYRWEGRYLRGDDQASLIGQMRTVHLRIQRPLMAIRPELTSRQRWTLSTSALSVIGSIVDHRAKLPAIQVRALLADLADAVLAADLPDQRGLVIAAQVAAFPAVEPAGLTVGHCGVDEGRDEPTQRQLGIACHLVGECRAVDQLLAQVEHRVAEQFVLARVVAVQRGSGDAHPLRDGLHADAVVAERAERLGRRTGDLRLAILRPAPDTLGTGRPGACHGQHHNGPIAYIAVHFDWKIRRNCSHM